MNRSFINSSVTDVIKFTRTVNFDPSSGLNALILFLDQTWNVTIASQKTRYWTFSIKLWLRSSPFGRKLAAVSGWINSLDGCETEDDWTDPETQPQFKIMKKTFEVGDDKVEPIFVSPNHVGGSEVQLKLVIELFDENLRSSKLIEQNQVVEKLFSSKKGYDVTIVAADGKVRAHRWILKMKSRYFEAMFDSELGDKGQDEFKISDIPSVVLNEILRFLYTGKVQDIDAIAFDILVWSDFFAIDDLRDLSADIVIKSLHPENLINVLEHAINTNQEHLRDKTIAYFRKNVDQVVASRTWLSTYKNLPSSVQEIIKVLVRK